MFLRSLNCNIEPELVSALVFTDVQRSIFLFYCTLSCKFIVCSLVLQSMNITKVYIVILPGISYQLYAKHYDIKKEKSSMYLSIIFIFIFLKVSVSFLLSPPLSISVSFY